MIAVQAVTVGSEVTELMAKLEADGEFAEQLFVHGLGVQTAEGLAEWLHYEARGMLGIPATQGRRYSWGYPAVPEQSEHLKVEQLLGLGDDRHEDHRRLRARARAVDARAVAHHPQAIYFGTRQGRLLQDGSPDDLIRGSARDPSLTARSTATLARRRPARGRRHRGRRPGAGRDGLALRRRATPPTPGDERELGGPSRAA